MEDADILELLFEHSEMALDEVDKKYGGLLRHISYNILNNMEDAEECVNDTYFGIWNCIPPQRPNPLLPFFCRIARNQSLKRYREKHAQKRYSEYEVSLDELAECVPAGGNIDEEVELKELIGIVEGFLSKLSLGKRTMFVRRYWFADSIEDIARDFGISQRNVSMKLYRMRKQLRQILIRKGVVI